MSPAALTACDSASSCRTAIIEQVEDAGRASANAALALVLSDDTFKLNKHGWAPGNRATRPGETVTFVSGRDQVRTFRSSVNGQWYSDKIIDC